MLREYESHQIRLSQGGLEHQPEGTKPFLAQTRKLRRSLFEYALLRISIAEAKILK